MPTVLFALLISGSNLFGQNHIFDLPELKNIYSEDKFPHHSVLVSYIDNFDLLISLKNYSAWGPDENIKVLAHHGSDWYKIEINTDHKNFGTFDAVCYLMFKIPDSVGDIVLKVLKDNHLFEMKDERSQFSVPCGPIVTDTIYDKGKKEIILSGVAGSDGPEFEFELLTASQYKKLYFYSPGEKSKHCSNTKELEWVNNCITVFEKYLGR